MAISGIGATPTTHLPPTTQSIKATGKAADGDYKVATGATSSVKDSDGDFKVLPSTGAKASIATQQALNSLQKGG